MSAEQSNARLPWLVPSGLVVLILGGVYVVTLMPGVGYSGDTAKFQFLGKVLGTPHATGYPTYLLLNHLFVSVFPLGSLAYKANLLSAVFTVAASVVLLQTLRALGIPSLIAAVTTVTFGLTATAWLHSLVAEVYSLHLLFVALVIFFFLRWTQTRADRYFLVAWACYGLSFGNHLTTVTLLPAIIYVMWATDRKVFRDPRKLLWIALWLTRFRAAVPTTITPFSPLKAIKFPAWGTLPPITLSKVYEAMYTPFPPFGSDVVPLASTPM